MKKQLCILSAVALATASAQAYTIFDNKDSGTKIDFTGSARLVWKSTSNKTNEGDQTYKEHINHAVANNGSRFGFKITQELGNDFYALGRAEWRFRGTSRSQHDFDDLYTRQLFAGVGHKQLGELTYGHMTTITDEAKQTDLGNTLSLSDGLLIGSARKVAQYTYKGIEGLKVGAFYGQSSKRNMNALDLRHKRKDVFGLAATYKMKLDDMQSIKFGTGVTRERSWNTNNTDFAKTAYAFGTAYTFDKTTIGLDLERAVTNDQNASGNKRLQKEVRTVIEQKITNDWRAYAMYAHKTNKLNNVVASNTKSKTNQYMMGTEYFIVPSYVKGFVEVRTDRTKKYADGIKTAKVRDNIVAVGLRASW